MRVYVVFLCVTSLLDIVRAQSGPLVTLSQGPVRGTIITRERRQVFAYLGIPYAQAPIAELRFQVWEILYPRVTTLNSI